MTDYTTMAAELLELMLENTKLEYHRGTVSFSRGEMSILAQLCYKKDGLSPGELCETLGMTTPRVSAVLSGLLRKEYICRTVDPSDRRRIHIYITDEGRSYTSARYSTLTDNITELLRSLGEDDAREYLRIVGKIGELLHN